MNEYERSYQHYLRTLPRREKKRLQSAAWAKAHPNYWRERKKPLWLQETHEILKRGSLLPRGSVVEMPNTYLWLTSPHPSSQIPLQPERRSSHKA